MSSGRTLGSLALSLPLGAVEPSRRPGQTTWFVLHCGYFLFSKILKLHHNVKMLFPTTPRDWEADGFIGGTRTEGSVGHQSLFQRRDLQTRIGQLRTLHGVDLLWESCAQASGEPALRRGVGDTGRPRLRQTGSRLGALPPSPRRHSECAHHVRAHGHAPWEEGRGNVRTSVCPPVVTVLPCGVFTWSGVRAVPASRSVGRCSRGLRLRMESEDLDQLPSPLGQFTGAWSGPGAFWVQGC